MVNGAGGKRNKKKQEAFGQGFIEGGGTSGTRTSALVEWLSRLCPEEDRDAANSIFVAL